MGGMGCGQRGIIACWGLMVWFAQLNLWTSVRNGLSQKKVRNLMLSIKSLKETVTISSIITKSKGLSLEGHPEMQPSPRFLLSPRLSDTGEIVPQSEEDVLHVRATGVS